MDLVKKILGTLLGAGKGLFGTMIRVGLAGAAGYFVSKGYIGADEASSITDQLVGAALAILSAIGSALNSEKMLNTPVPK